MDGIRSGSLSALGSLLAGSRGGGAPGGRPAILIRSVRRQVPPLHAPCLLHRFIAFAPGTASLSLPISIPRTTSIMSSSEAPPSNANEGCVGPQSEDAGKASACAGCPNQSASSSGKFSSPEAVAAQQAEADQIRAALSTVSHALLVLSGKGGVGKSTVASQMAWTLASRGYSVGVLDVDICGPSAARMLGATGQTVHANGTGWTPVYVSPNLAVMSVSFLLPDADAAVVWRGPRKNGMIKQFLTETVWDDDGLDYLIIDTPPGTSDEHISTVQYLQAVGGGSVVPLW